ncbi:hypothetical protein, partial [Anaerovibrio slackiae]|uniref:hypothetical protein n=1 Tax=Anaerovibrio slackiae TaxID=2652309 RepID=UPI00386E78BF
LGVDSSASVPALALLLRPLEQLPFAICYILYTMLQLSTFDTRNCNLPVQKLEKWQNFIHKILKNNATKVIKWYNNT